MNQPLADLLRPESLDEVIGQRHLIGEGKILSNLVKNEYLPNLILYGPPGIGKSTLALILAQCTTRKPIRKINATDAGLKEIKEIIAELDTLQGSQGFILYLDEIHHFNKKQQQSLLKYLENGQITLIASTTENPYFNVFSAILSRSTVLELKSLEPTDIEDGLSRAITRLEERQARTIHVEEAVIKTLAIASNGDFRKALNYLELLVCSQPQAKDLSLTEQDLAALNLNSAYFYDRDGDQHYDTISAFQKSIRGSDVDASLHYLARLIKAGDLAVICRRLLVIASEDIGMAYPQAISIVKDCVDSSLQLGLPEARFALAQAVVLLASAPKSNSLRLAIDEALADLEKGHIGKIPSHLKEGHYQGAKKLGHGKDYLYPHNFPNHFVHQQYLPDKLKNRCYYRPGMNKTEQQYADYLKFIKK